jgi:hypothetical protein
MFAFGIAGGINEPLKSVAHLNTARYRRMVEIDVKHCTASHSSSTTKIKTYKAEK